MKIDLDNLNKGVNGIEFLRRLVNWYGYRDEYLNANKSPIQLINEFKRHLRDEIDLDGNEYTD